MRTFSVIQELPTTACHLLVEIVKELFVLDYSRVHSLNHGQFQINCATISSTTCFSSSLVSFSMEISSDSGRISSISLIFILFTCTSFRLLSSSSRTLINVSWKVLFQSDGQIAITHANRSLKMYEPPLESYVLLEYPGGGVGST